VSAFSADTLTGENVVTGACDDAMVYGLLVWASSLQETAQRPFHLVVAFLQDRLSEPNRALVDSTLNHIGMSHSFLPLAPDQRFLAQGHVSPTTFTKFLIADAIELEHLWIDVDTVALPGWDTLFDYIHDTPSSVDLVVAERGDTGDRAHQDRAHQDKTEGQDIVTPSDLAFNAGVLGWPKGARKPWAETIQSLGNVPTIEQYTLNVLYSKSLRRVPEKYNLLTYRIEQIDSEHMPQIIHYAGAHKPWHLDRRFSKECTNYQCPWSLWFLAEQSFLESLKDFDSRIKVSQLRHRALTSGKVFWRRDHSGVIFLRLLRYLGVLGWLIVLGAKPFKKYVPRGTHPLHG